MRISENLAADLPASIVVFFVAVPLCLGIALASGAPLIAGLIAGIIGGILVGSISGSPLGVSGPAAGLAVIVLTAIETLGSFEAFLLAVVLAGAIQALMGLAGAGVLGYFFPSSVIKGMLSGIGILIVLKQIPHALGHDTDPIGDLAFQQPDGETTMSSLSMMTDDFTIGAIVIAAVSLGILILWEAVLSNKGKLFKLIQGPLVVVAFGILFQLIAKSAVPSLAVSPEHLVSVPVPGSFSEIGSLFAFPDWSQIGSRAIWVTAVTLAIVASLETLLCVEATDKLDPLKRVTPTNRELLAQGVGNMASGAIGGLPVTQVIVRSSANIQSGGRTKLSAILHGVLMAIFVLALPAVLNLIPLAALAAILLVVGYKLSKPAVFKEMFAKGPEQYLPFVVTVAGIVFTDLLTGIALGMGVAIIVLLRNHYLNSHFLHLDQSDTNEGRTTVTITLAEEVTFLNKGALRRELDKVPEGALLRLDAKQVVNADYDVVEIFDDFKSSAAGRSIDVELIGDLVPGRRSPQSPPTRHSSQPVA